MKPSIGKDGIPILEQLVNEQAPTNNDNRFKQLDPINRQQLNNIIQRINNDINKELEILVRVIKNNIADDLKKAFAELQRGEQKEK